MGNDLKWRRAGRDTLGKQRNPAKFDKEKRQTVVMTIWHNNVFRIDYSVLDTLIVQVQECKNAGRYQGFFSWFTYLADYV